MGGRNWPEALPDLGDSALGLRQPTLDDVPALVAACNDPLAARFTRLPVPYEVTDAQYYVRSAAEGWQGRTSAQFVIVGDGRVLGTCSLRVESEDPSAAEVGYLVAPWARNRGVARAAVGLITDWAHIALGLERVVADIEDLNPASITVVVALGYQQVEPGHHLELKGAQRAMHHWQHRAAR